MRVDHLIWATADFEASEARLRNDFGLAAVGGGTHEGHGTVNRIVPLAGGTYIELLAVDDATAASGSPLGRAALAAPEGLLGWAVAVPGVEIVATRLELSRTQLVRGALRMSLAGLEESLTEPWRPFFIERPDIDGGDFAGDDAPALATVGVACRPDALEAWLGPDHGLPVEVVDDQPYGLRWARLGGGQVLRAPRAASAAPTPPPDLEPTSAEVVEDFKRQLGWSRRLAMRVSPGRFLRRRYRGVGIAAPDGSELGRSDGFGLGLLVSWESEVEVAKAAKRLRMPARSLRANFARLEAAGLAERVGPDIWIATDAGHKAYADAEMSAVVSDFDARPANRPARRWEL